MTARHPFPLFATHPLSRYFRPPPLWPRGSPSIFEKLRAAIVFLAAFQKYFNANANAPFHRLFTSHHKTEFNKMPLAMNLWAS